MSSVHTGRKKNSSPLMGVIAFITAAALFMVLSTTIFFNIENITVTGSSNYTPDEIISASRLVPGDNLIRTSTGRTEKQIEKSLVYVEKANISRSFPDTLIIDIEPSVPAANFICEGYILLISRGGKVLEKLDEPKAGLYNFYGTEPSAALLPGDMFESYDEHKNTIAEELLRYCVETGDSSITSVDMTDRSGIRYSYEDRIKVNVGSINDISYKMNFSREIINKNLAENAEGELTILSDSTGASFLDKESLEHNEQVFRENDPKNTETEALEEEEEEDEEEPHSYAEME